MRGKKVPFQTSNLCVCFNISECARNPVHKNSEGRFVTHHCWTCNVSLGVNLYHPTYECTLLQEIDKVETKKSKQAKVATTATTSARIPQEQGVDPESAKNSLANKRNTKGSNK